MTFAEKYPGETLRALSWKQPFASLMLHVKVETRVWDSRYFGWVLICASKSPYSLKQLQDISGMVQLRRMMEYIPAGVLNQRMGMAIAIGRLVKSVPMGNDVLIKSQQEIEDECFVRFNSSLFTHIYEDVQPIVPFEWKGSQGWRTVDEETKSKIILL